MSAIAAGGGLSLESCMREIYYEFMFEVFFCQHIFTSMIKIYLSFMRHFVYLEIFN